MGEIGEGLLKMDQYQEICDLDGFKISPPMMEEIPAMLVLAEQLKGLVQHQILAV
ncbi:hypothetical protein VU06_04480 [Desulfobulbus sp. F3]|nr:hypothetical protein [Desulfobulbus sp. F3]